MLGHLIHPEIEEMIHTRDLAGLRTALADWSPVDLAELLTEMPADTQAIVFRILPRKLATDTFAYLTLEAQEELLKALGHDQVAGILNDMSPDDRTALLEELPGAATKQLLTLLSPSERVVALKLLGYPEHSIGRLMTPDYLAVHEELTVAGTLDYIRAHGRDSETINVIYVVDHQGVLIDDIRIREIILAQPDKPLADIRTHTFVSLRAADDQETAVEAFAKYDRVALPVTDTSGVLVGVVTVDDVLDVAQAEATEDIQKIGGMEALDDPYMAVPIAGMVKKRAGWLAILFVGEMLTASALGFFEGEIQQAVVLALFLPLIISSGGNSGSQATTLIIRAVSLGQVRPRDWWRIMRREIVTGAALGAILGAIGFARIALWTTFSDIYGPHWALVGTTIFIALMGVVLWGSLIGSMFPLLLRRLGVDPAVASAPFVATLVDVTGIIIYFTVAMFVLRGSML